MCVCLKTILYRYVGGDWSNDNDLDLLRIKVSDRDNMCVCPYGGVCALCPKPLDDSNSSSAEDLKIRSPIALTYGDTWWIPLPDSKFLGWIIKAPGQQETNQFRMWYGTYWALYPEAKRRAAAATGASIAHPHTAATYPSSNDDNGSIANENDANRDDLAHLCTVFLPPELGRDGELHRRHVPTILVAKLPNCDPAVAFGSVGREEEEEDDDEEEEEDEDEDGNDKILPGGGSGWDAAVLWGEWRDKAIVSLSKYDDNGDFKISADEVFDTVIDELDERWVREVNPCIIANGIRAANEILGYLNTIKNLWQKALSLVKSEEQKKVNPGMELEAEGSIGFRPDSSKKSTEWASYEYMADAAPHVVMEMEWLYDRKICVAALGEKWGELLEEETQ